MAALPSIPKPRLTFSSAAGTLPAMRAAASASEWFWREVDEEREGTLRKRQS